MIAFYLGRARPVAIEDMSGIPALQWTGAAGIVLILRVSLRRGPGR